MEHVLNKDNKSMKHSGVASDITQKHVDILCYAAVMYLVY